MIARTVRRRTVAIATSAIVLAALTVTTTFALAPRTEQVSTAGRQASGQPVDPSTVQSSVDPAPSGSEAATAPDAPAGKADVAASAAASAVTSVITATNSLLTTPGSVPKDLARFTGGFVEGELLALAAERESLGYTQVGTTVITSITTAKKNLDGDPPTVVLNVCIDSSGVDVLDASGASLKASLYDPGHPVLNVYGAQYIDGTWKIVSHDLPSATSPSSNSPEKHDKKEPCT